MAMIVTVIITWRMLASPFGRVLKAIREDETAAMTLGKNVVKQKLIALATGAFFAGIAGSLYAHYITFIDPTSFTLMETILMFCMVVLGGLGSIPGSILGAIIIVLLPEPLRFLSLPSSVMAAARQMIYSTLLILLIIYKPSGILGEAFNDYEKYKKYKDIPTRIVTVVTTIATRAKNKVMACLR